MTEVIYLKVSEKTEAAQKAGRRVSISGMLKFLGISRSGYHAWLHRVPSDTEKCRESVKEKIPVSYTHLELFQGFGEKCAVLEEMPENFEMSDQIAHANLCGFGKSVIQAVLEGKAEELVLVNCCDSMRRVYDIVESTGKDVYKRQTLSQSNMVFHVKNRVRNQDAVYDVTILVSVHSEEAEKKNGKFKD